MVCGGRGLGVRRVKRGEWLGGRGSREDGERRGLPARGSSWVGCVYIINSNIVT